MKKLINPVRNIFLNGVNPVRNIFLNGVNLTFFLLLFLFIGVNLANAATWDCSSYGGINCSAGADWDGSVICYNGWRNSSINYNDEAGCQGHNYSSDPMLCHTYTYNDKDEMEDWEETYSGYILTYQTYYYDCLETLSRNACDLRYDTQLDIFRGCISEAELVPPIDCPEYALYNFDEKECECMSGHLYLNNECKLGDSYCREEYGNSYYYNTTLATCQYSEEIGKINNENYCLDRYGEYAIYDKVNLKCRCYDGFEIKDDECVQRVQLVIPPTEAGQVLGVTYLSGNPLGLESGWLIKNKKYVETFYVDENLCLQWIINEQAAEKHFGETWNSYGNIKEFDEVPGEHYSFCENLE